MTKNLVMTNKEYSKKKEELHEELTQELANMFLGEKSPLHITHKKTGELIIQANRKITKTKLRHLSANYNNVDIEGHYPICKKIMEMLDGVAIKFDVLESVKPRTPKK